MQDDKLENMADIMQIDDIYFSSTPSLNFTATEGQIRKGSIFDRNLHCSVHTEQVREIKRMCTSKHSQ